MSQDIPEELVLERFLAHVTRRSKGHFISVDSDSTSLCGIWVSREAIEPVVRYQTITLDRRVCGHCKKALDQLEEQGIKIRLARVDEEWEYYDEDEEQEMLPHTPSQVVRSSFRYVYVGNDEFKGHSLSTEETTKGYSIYQDANKLFVFDAAGCGWTRWDAGAYCFPRWQDAKHSYDQLHPEVKGRSSIVAIIEEKEPQEPQYYVKTRDKNLYMGGEEGSRCFGQIHLAAKYTKEQAEQVCSRLNHLHLDVIAVK